MFFFYSNRLIVRSTRSTRQSIVTYVDYVRGNYFSFLQHVITLWATTCKMDYDEPVFKELFRF